MQVGDFTGSTYVTCFSDVGEKILGKSSEDLGKLKDADEVSTTTPSVLSAFIHSFDCLDFGRVSGRFPGSCLQAIHNAHKGQD